MSEGWHCKNCSEWKRKEGGRFANIFAKSFWHELNIFLGKKSHGRVYCTDNLSVFLLLAVLRIKIQCIIYTVWYSIYIPFSSGKYFQTIHFLLHIVSNKIYPRKVKNCLQLFCYNLHCGVDPIEYYGGTYEKKTCHTLRENLTNLGRKIY